MRTVSPQQNSFGNIIKNRMPSGYLKIGALLVLSFFSFAKRQQAQNYAQGNINKLQVARNVALFLVERKILLQPYREIFQNLWGETLSITMAMQLALRNGFNEEGSRNNYSFRFNFFAKTPRLPIISDLEVKKRNLETAGLMYAVPSFVRLCPLEEGEGKVTFLIRIICYTHGDLFEWNFSPNTIIVLKTSWYFDTSPKK